MLFQDREFEMAMPFCLRCLYQIQIDCKSVHNVRPPHDPVAICHVSFTVIMFSRPPIVEDSIYLGFWFTYKELLKNKLKPHGRNPKKVPINIGYIHVNNNNFIIKKRLQVAVAKQVVSWCHHGATRHPIVMHIRKGTHMHPYKYCSYTLCHHVNWS